MLAAALLLLWLAGALPASATEVLDAVDHAELAAEVSAAGVSRIALLGDRVARVIRAPGGYRVEHDPGSGDLWLRPPADGADGAALDPDRGPGPASPVALFVGTERGFTYRLMLTPAEGGPAQILIRNAAIAAAAHTRAAMPAAETRIAAIARLIRAVANREPLAGYAIEAGASGAGDDGAGDIDDDAAVVVEVWRGPRFTALVLDPGPDAPSGPAALAAHLGPGIAAVWLAAPEAGSGHGRLAVAVREGLSR